MANPNHLNLARTERRIYLTAVTAEELIRTFLAAHPWSPQFLASPNQSHAIAAMEITLKLMEVFNDRSAYSDQEKQDTYLKFISTMSTLSKSLGVTRKEDLMDKICSELGVIFYNRPETGPQIKQHLADHLRILENTWPKGDSHTLVMGKVSNK